MRSFTLSLAYIPVEMIGKALSMSTLLCFLLSTGPLFAYGSLTQPTLSISWYSLPKIFEANRWGLFDRNNSHEAQLRIDFRSPNSGNLAVYYSTPSKEFVRLQLSNGDGNEVIHMTIDGCQHECGVVVPMEGLKSGVYFLTLHQGNQHVRRKVVHF